MDSTHDQLDIIISKNHDLVQSNIMGINFLEMLKYLIVEDLKLIKDFQIKKIVNNIETDQNKLKILEFSNYTMMPSLNYYHQTYSKIKSSSNFDNLSIVIEGFKTITLYDFNKIKKSVSLHLSKNMGLVLAKNTILSQNIAPGSIILDVFVEKKEIDIEK